MIKAHYSKSELNKSHHKLLNDFIKFLQKEYPLKKDVNVRFVTKRVNKMTTGQRTDEHNLYILTRDRLNRDVLRTLAHEWVHEHQHAVEHKKTSKKPNLKLEDEANELSARFLNKYEKSHPKKKPEIYRSYQK